MTNSANALTTFNHPQFGSIRMITKDNDPWFVARDVCDILGISNTGNAYARLDADEKCYIQRTDVGMNPGRSLMLISESGFYKLILRANSSPVATAFQNWVTREVLPAIRKDGMYVMGEEKVKTGEKSLEELALMVVTGLQAKIARLAEEKAIVEAKVLELAPKASKYDRYLEADGRLFGVSGRVFGQGCGVLGGISTRPRSLLGLPLSRQPLSLGYLLTGHAFCE